MRSTRFIAIHSAAVAKPFAPLAVGREISVPKDIKSYCLDFNWAERGGFAEPGKWAEADPAETVAWHKTIGSNVIQTFCVSTNGYSWYKNGVVPEQPGLQHDFLREVVKLGHAEEANPKCIIWLTTNNVNHPHVVDSDMYKQVDWFMGEKGNINKIKAAEAMVGEDTHMITCLAFWNGQNATVAMPAALEAGIGLYGFAKSAHNKKGIIPLDRILPKQLSELTGDSSSIAVLARAYHGKSIDSVWNGKTFVEADPPPFRIEFRGRKGWFDTARITHDKAKSVITIHNPYQSGRGQLTRVGGKWPDSLVIRLLRKNPDTLTFEWCNGEKVR